MMKNLVNMINLWMQLDSRDKILINKYKNNLILVMKM